MGYFSDAKIIAIEVKTPKVYKHLCKNYEALRTYSGSSRQKNHLRDQIEFVESIKKAGGLGMFACSINQVKNQLDHIKKAS